MSVHVVVLVAKLTLRLDPVGPVDDHRVSDAAEVRVLLAELERRVAGQRPAHGVVVVGARLTELVDPLEVAFHGLRRLAGEDRDALLVEDAR